MKNVPSHIPSLSNIAKNLCISTSNNNNTKSIKEEKKEETKSILSTTFIPKIIAKSNTNTTNVTKTAKTKITNTNSTSNMKNASLHPNNLATALTTSNTTTSKPVSKYNSSLKLKADANYNNASKNISNSIKPVNQNKSVKSLAMKVESKIPSKGNCKVPIPATNEKKQTWNASASFAPMSRISPDLSNSPIKNNNFKESSYLPENSDIDYSNTKEEKKNIITNNLQSIGNGNCSRADKPSRHCKPISPQLNDTTATTTTTTTNNNNNNNNTDININKLVIEVPPFNNQSSTNNDIYYPLKSLQNHPYPSNIDVKNREIYLNNYEFFNVFKMDKKEFDILPLWKKMQIKKSVGLF
jgi:hypothetical protein